MSWKAFDTFFSSKPILESAEDQEWCYAYTDEDGTRIEVFVQELSNEFGVVLTRKGRTLVSLAGRGVEIVDIEADEQGQFLSIQCEVELVRAQARIRLQPHLEVSWLFSS